MAITQPKRIAPPQSGDTESLVDFSAIIQDNFTKIFELAHIHSIRTSAPPNNEGRVGDIFLVESSGTFSLYAKFPSGWKSTTLT